MAGYSAGKVAGTGFGARVQSNPPPATKPVAAVKNSDTARNWPICTEITGY